MKKNENDLFGQSNNANTVAVENPSVNEVVDNRYKKLWWLSVDDAKQVVNNQNKEYVPNIDKQIKLAFEELQKSADIIMPVGSDGRRITDIENVLNNPGNTVLAASLVRQPSFAYDTSGLSDADIANGCVNSIDAFNHPSSVASAIVDKLVVTNNTSDNG